MTEGFGGDAGYRPRVRTAYYTRVYYHSSEEHPLYSNTAHQVKEGQHLWIKAERHWTELGFTDKKRGWKIQPRSRFRI